MIDARRRAPTGDGVTGFAYIGRGDVRGVFSDCRHAVVACNAIANNPGVIETCSGPRGGRVATVAFDRCLDMGCAFSACTNIVVAT